MSTLRERMHRLREVFTAYQDALASDEMRFRIYVMVQPDLYEALKSAGVRTGFGDARLRVGGIKLFADGSASDRTMRMSEPFEGRPDDFGILTTTPEQLNEAVEDTHAHRFQVGGPRASGTRCAFPMPPIRFIRSRTARSCSTVWACAVASSPS